MIGKLLKYKFTHFHGEYQKELSVQKINRDQLNRILDEYVSISAKEETVFTYEYPQLKNLNCFYELCFYKHFEDFMYSDIGYIYPADRVEIWKKEGEDYLEPTYYLRCQINTENLKKLILHYYWEHRTNKDAEKHLEEDMRIVQEYMNYEAEMTVDNILRNTF